MALFDDRLAEDTVAVVRRRYQELGALLGEPAGREPSGPQGEPSVLRRDLLLLIRVANGEYPRTEALIREVAPSLTRVLDLLLGNAVHSKAMIQDDFWNSGIGTVASRVRWWIYSDDLITISNAAALAFGENTQATRMRIARAVDQGLLEWVPDPSVANPQQNRRVLRPQVERLRDQRRLPD